jgi:type 1 glutamine amidotransferase
MLIPMQTILRSCYTLAVFASFGWMTISIADESSTKEKLVVMIAGTPSHGYGAHEHYAGCRLLADVIHSGVKGVRCEVIQNGWPADDAILDKADCIVIYADGGGKHPALPHMDRLEKQIKRGAGFVCIHYAVEVPPGEKGDQFKEWLGGYFETNWSVNPHWVANFKTFPDHPVSRGVTSFSADDEWYFHMRFRDGMKGITPVLSDIAPESTMSRKDGLHSGNPHVRKAVADKQPQHVAWAYQRDDGGRSFGFTGGHNHWNWSKPSMQRIVANAILWTAKAEVPRSGIPCGPKGLEELKANQDYPVPEKFSAEDTIKKFELSSSK